MGEEEKENAAAATYTSRKGHSMHVPPEGKMSDIQGNRIACCRGPPVGVYNKSMGGREIHVRGQGESPYLGSLCKRERGKQKPNLFRLIFQEYKAEEQGRV